MDLIDWFIEELFESILLHLTISLQRLVRAAELSSLASVQGSNQRLAVLFFGEIEDLKKKMCPMRFSNDLDSIVQVQYPPEWKSGHLDLTWSMSSVVRHKMGWELFIHCIVGHVRTPKNTQIFLLVANKWKSIGILKYSYFSSGKQMDPRGSPDLAEALSTH